MMLRRETATFTLALVLAGCNVGSSGTFDPGDQPDAAIFEDLDKERAQANYVTSTDLMRRVVAPTCAAETNECHNNEDFPDLHTEANLWNLVQLPCNLGVGERETVEDFCEAVGDQIRITDGGNANYTATIGSIQLVTDEGTGDFLNYTVQVETPPGQTQAGATFEFVRNGVVVAALGGGNSLDASAGSTTLTITDADDLEDPAAVIQGDENRNGVFGNGTGMIVSPGNAESSYMVHRLLQVQTTRVRMPLNENADNPTEVARYLSPDEMYAIMSWINCMQEGDGISSPIRYDCAENSANQGAL